MITQVIDAADKNAVILAADLIKRGELVAFPTETVYGLGGNGLDADAVTKIYEAKGRPADNPLILHISAIDELYPLVREVPEKALVLADKFWPGPLTMIFKKADIVPNAVTCGLDTVAIRMPSHPFANAFIRTAGLPIAAPSANRSGSPSPTEAKFVFDDLSGRIPLIVDGGRCTVGLESTVISMSGCIPTILRPGGVTKEVIEAEIGRVDIHPGALRPVAVDKAASPGMKYRHYAPKAKLVLVDSGAAREKYDEAVCNGLNAAILASEETAAFYGGCRVKIYGSIARPESIAANLFRCLRELDAEGTDIIVCESTDTNGIGLAIMNRLYRAEGKPPEGDGK